VLVGKEEVRYRVIHLTVRPACGPNSLNCICARRRNLRTIIIEKQQFYFVVARSCLANRNICQSETNNEWRVVKFVLQSCEWEVRVSQLFCEELLEGLKINHKL
jgi:hypothetical protein